MKTSLDIVDKVYGVLNGGTLSQAISGKIYKHKRPINSKKEDVVIETLANVNIDLQVAIVNVNVHVPDLITAAGGAQDSQPDHVRLNALAALAVNNLDNKTGTDFSFNVQQQLLAEDSDAGEHYINIRLEFYSINILN